jgi:hypothetical protein
LPFSSCQRPDTATFTQIDAVVWLVFIHWQLG